MGTNQGEGDREAARRYDQQQQDFVKSGQVDDAAAAAAPRTPQEEQAMQQAEQAGRAKSRGEDPTIAGGSGGSEQAR